MILYIYEQNDEINGHGNPLPGPRDTLYPQKLVLSSPTSGGRSVGIVRLRTKSHGVMIYMYVYIVTGSTVAMQRSREGTRVAW
jgi:hypothetical protein